METATLAAATLDAVRDSYEHLYGPDGRYRYDRYSLSTIRKRRRETAEALLTARKPKDRARLEGSLAGLEKCLALKAAEQKYARRVTFRQVGGDDGYHYAVFVDGRRTYAGLTRSEAIYYKSLAVKELASRG